MMMIPVKQPMYVPGRPSASRPTIVMTAINSRNRSRHQTGKAALRTVGDHDGIRPSYPRQAGRATGGLWGFPPRPTCTPGAGVYDTGQDSPLFPVVVLGMSCPTRPVRAALVLT